MKYIIENITDKIGQTRKDDRYPNRIDSEVSFIHPPQIGQCCFFRYTKYKNGKCIEDHITRTSPVTNVDNYHIPGYLIIYTLNSIYYFKKQEE